MPSTNAAYTYHADGQGDECSLNIVLLVLHHRNLPDHQQRQQKSIKIAERSQWLRESIEPARWQLVFQLAHIFLVVSIRSLPLVLRFHSHDLINTVKYHV